MRLIGLICLALAGISEPGLTQDYQRLESGWEIITDFDVVPGNNGCAASQQYADGPGASSLMLNLREDGTLMVVSSNYGWSLAQREYRISMIFDQAAFVGAFLGMPRSSGSEVPSLVWGGNAADSATLLRHFTQSNSVQLRFEDGGVIDDLSLAGSAEAVASMRRCVERVASERAAAAAERARLGHIPDDPFANK